MAKQKRYNGYLRKCFTYEGKKYTIYGKTNDELMEKVFQKKQELKRGILSLKNPSLNEYYKTFTDIRRKQIKGSTIRTQAIYYNTMAKVELVEGIPFGNMKMRDIKRNHIEKVRELLLDKGMTAESLNVYIKHLKTVFNNAEIDETIDKNPCKAIKPLKRDTQPIQENRHRALTIDETKRFFEEAKRKNSYYLNAFLLMIKTGMRQGEVTSLYYTDIDLKNGFIHIRRSTTVDELGSICIGKNAKTKNSNRDIPLTDELLSIIQRQKNQNNMLFGLSNDGLLFKSIQSGGIITQTRLNNEIKRICDKTGIEYFTCHAFRNTFATRFIEQRPQDYKILSELLGHKDISITLNLYTHVMTENKVLAMNDILIKTS